MRRVGWKCDRCSLSVQGQDLRAYFASEAVLLAPSPTHRREKNRGKNSYAEEKKC